EPFRSKVLQGRAPELSVRPLSAHQEALLREPGATRRDLLSELLFPEPTFAFREGRATYGDVSVIDTLDYLHGLADEQTEHIVEIERGVQLNIGLEAIGEPDKHGVRTVMTTLNGQLR